MDYCPDRFNGGDRVCDLGNASAAGLAGTPAYSSRNSYAHKAPLPTPAVPTLGTDFTWTRPVDDMLMVFVPHGEFSMGNDGESVERPKHTVFLQSYLIDKTEVTNTRYATCVNSGVCQAPSSVSSQKHTSYYDNPEYSEYPVVYVNWNDAKPIASGPECACRARLNERRLRVARMA